MPKMVISSAALVLLVNLIVLLGVAYNRSDESVAQLVLTERELNLPQYYFWRKENSGMALPIRWSALDENKRKFSGYPYSRTPDWLTESKVKSLGVDIDELKNIKHKDFYGFSYKRITREVIYVLEYNGQEYARALQLIKSLSLKEQKRFKVAESRLFVIDVGLDKTSLLEKYNDKSKYLLLAGELRVIRNNNQLTASIRRLYIPRIHVPLPESELISKLTAERLFYQYNKEPIEPRFEIRLNIGKRLEPWIESVRAL